MFSFMSKVFKRNMTSLNNVGMNLKEPSVVTEHATLGQQCFWGPDGQYPLMFGVIRTRVGYCGGQMDKPTYHRLGDHTEAVDIEFDPQQTTFRKILDIFWKSHDPTQSHKTQYMSAIFYNSDQQKLEAEESLKEAQKKFSKPIVTKILPMRQFYEAEDYHQKYRLRGHSELLKSLNLNNQQLIKSHVAAKLNGYLSGHGTVEMFDKEAKELGLAEEQISYVRQQIAKGGFGSCH